MAVFLSRVSGITAELAMAIPIDYESTKPWDITDDEYRGLVAAYARSEQHAEDNNQQFSVLYTANGFIHHGHWYLRGYDIERHFFDLRQERKRLYMLRNRKTIGCKAMVIRELKRFHNFWTEDSFWLRDALDSFNRLANQAHARRAHALQRWAISD